MPRPITTDRTRAVTTTVRSGATSPTGSSRAGASRTRTFEETEGQRQAQQPARDADEKVLGQQLAKESAPARAERGAQAHLPLPLDAPRQPGAREIGAPHQQDEEHRDLNQEEIGLDARAELFAEGTHRDRHGLILLIAGIGDLEPGRDQIHLGAGGRERGGLAQPTEDLVVDRIAGPPNTLKAPGGPDLGSLGEIEALSA